MKYTRNTKPSARATSIELSLIARQSMRRSTRSISDSSVVHSLGRHACRMHTRSEPGAFARLRRLPHFALLRKNAQLFGALEGRNSPAPWPGFCIFLKSSSLDPGRRARERFPPRTAGVLGAPVVSTPCAPPPIVPRTPSARFDRNDRSRGPHVSNDVLAPHSAQRRRFCTAHTLDLVFVSHSPPSPGYGLRFRTRFFSRIDDSRSRKAVGCASQADNSNENQYFSARRPRSRDRELESRDRSRCGKFGCAVVGLPPRGARVGHHCSAPQCSASEHGHGEGSDRRTAEGQEEADALSGHRRHAP